MAVATPVLERKVSVTKKDTPQTTTYNGVLMTSEELHNSRIKDNYAKLINPDYKIEDLFADPVQQESAAPVVQSAVAQQPAVAEKPYLVENARADSVLFRADSEINRIKVMPVAEIQAATENTEEESEDLRPTSTTIQYRTLGESDKKRDIKIISSHKEKVLSKKDKIIIATFIAVIVALFVLVIINSAIIANLNSDLYAIQDGLTTVRGALAGVNNDINDIINPDSIAQFAESHNMVLNP